MTAVAQPLPSKPRVLALGLVLLVLLTGLVVRLSDIQVRSSARYQDIGMQQRVRTAPVPAARGVIFDRNGEPLALSADRPTIWANPQLVSDPLAAATRLSPVLGIDVQTLQTKLAKSGQFSYLARKVEPEVAQKVEELAVEGVFLLDEPERFLPSGPLAQSLLGDVGIDNEGLSGLELLYDDVLSGQPGQLTTERDRSGREIAGGDRTFVAPTPGRDVVVSLDRSLQYEAERLLSNQIVATGANGGMLLVMDVDTGDLLAMADLKADPNGGAPIPAPQLSPVVEVYEPGSVNKIITVAGALSEGLVTPDTELTVGSTIQLGPKVFSEHDPHPTEPWSVTRILADSSNVGTIMLAQDLGDARLDAYFRAFGYGHTTSLGWPGESAGLVLDLNDWASTTLGAVSIGQGVAVTGLQMLAAYNTIANDGVYVSPRLVTSTVGADGSRVPAGGEQPRPVVTPQVANEVSVMLTRVVQSGTGTRAAVPGYDVAGKTGTARKPAAGGRGYEQGAYVSSFVGFVPANDPAVTIMVVLDKPYPIFGGVVAAPVFSSMAAYTLRHLLVPPVEGAGATDAAADPTGDVSAGAAAAAAARQAVETGAVTTTTAPVPAEGPPGAGG
jgi:cell division protein FtsI (penicillin-binding protein 3)